MQNPDPRYFNDMSRDFTDAELCALFDISRFTLARWKSGKTPPHRAATLYLAARHGDLAALFGDDWDGFYFGRDKQFYHPAFKYGFNPYELKGLFFVRQEVRDTRAENKKLRAELAAEKENVWAMRRVREVARATGRRYPA